MKCSGKLKDSTLFTKELAGECLAARRHWKWPRNKPLEWALFTIDRSMDAVRDLLKTHPHVYPLIANTDRECVIGGERGAVLNPSSVRWDAIMCPWKASPSPTVKW